MSRYGHPLWHVLIFSFLPNLQPVTVTLMDPLSQVVDYLCVTKILGSACVVKELWETSVKHAWWVRMINVAKK